MEQRFRETTVIKAPPAVVWEVLTNPVQMAQWMGPPEMEVDVETDWMVGQPITIRGIHHARFENRGMVLSFEPPTLLRYSHLSSLSRLPDEPANYSVMDFALAPVAEGTALTVSLSGFPTEVTFKHLALYWRGTLGVVKDFIEQRWRPDALP